MWHNLTDAQAALARDGWRLWWKDFWVKPGGRGFITGHLYPWQEYWVIEIRHDFD